MLVLEYISKNCVYKCLEIWINLEKYEILKLFKDTGQPLAVAKSYK